MTSPLVIGNYEIIEKVGSGGLGEVYKAKHVETGKIVALKRLHEQYQYKEKLLGLFHKEIMIHSKVFHRHCVQFIEADLTKGNAHIVSSFVDGVNCYNLVRDHYIPPLIALCITFDMLRGIEHLHCLDIIHSDLSPSNVMVDKSGLTLVTDFGLSCVSEFEDYAGIQVGTPGYQAPERLMKKAVNQATDLYGVGIILWEMLKGSRLFFGSSPTEIKYRMEHIDVSWVNTSHSKLDHLIKQVLTISLKYHPEERFTTARDFMFAIHQCLKIPKISYTRRAILQWLVDEKRTSLPPKSPKQRIYIQKELK